MSLKRIAVAVKKFWVMGLGHISASVHVVTVLIFVIIRWLYVNLAMMGTR
jgi:hypothetical protein